jgi:hypothetical protein
MQLRPGSFCRWSIGLMAMVALGCSPERPKQELSETEMVRVLTEIYQYEEKINRLNQPRDSAEKIFAQASPAIFQRIGIPDSVFRTSYDYYLHRPEDLARIYSVVVDSLSLREQRLVAKPAER